MRLGDRGAMRVVHRIRAFAALRSVWSARLCVASALSAAQLTAGIREAIPMIAPWTEERVERLRNCINAGLTCSQIAGEIGMSRNAVIGKIHRLGLSQGRPAAAPARLRPPRVRRPRRTQRELLRVVFAQMPTLAKQATVEPDPIENAQHRSLVELGQHMCRWPINDPGNADFRFCGNDSIAGFSYCAAHARMAYQLTTR